MGTPTSKPLPPTSASGAPSAVGKLPVASSPIPVQPAQPAQPTRPPQSTQSTAPPSQTVVSNISAQQAEIAAIKEDERLEEALQQAKNAQALIATATAVSVGTSVLKAVLATTSVAAAVASLNPLTGPVILGGCLIIATLLKLRAGNLKLLSHLTVTSNKYVQLMNLTIISETLYNLMKAENDKLPETNPLREKFNKFSLNKGAVVETAGYFTLKLIMASPQRVVKVLLEKNIIKQTNIDKVNSKSLLAKRVSSSFSKTGFLGGITGDINRFMNSQAMIDSISGALNEFFMACQMSLNRFFILISVFKDLYASILPTFMATNAFKTLMSGDSSSQLIVEGTEITPEDMEKAGKFMEQTEMAIQAATGIDAVTPSADTLNMATGGVQENLNEAKAAEETVLTQIAAADNVNVAELRIEVRQEAKETVETTQIATAAMVAAGIVPPNPLSTRLNADIAANATTPVPTVVPTGNVTVVPTTNNAAKAANAARNNAAKAARNNARNNPVVPTVGGFRRSGKKSRKLSKNKHIKKYVLRRSRRKSKRVAY